MIHVLHSVGSGAAAFVGAVSFMMFAKGVGDNFENVKPMSFRQIGLCSIFALSVSLLTL